MARRDSPVVTCPDDKDTRSVVAGIIREFTSYLKKRGIGGQWQLELFRKTGSGGQDRCVFKRLSHGAEKPGETAMIFQIRPEDRDSSWKVYAFPPRGFDPQTLINASEVEPDEVEPVKAASGEVPATVGQVYQAKVTGHADYGLEIAVEVRSGKVVDGFIPLSDLPRFSRKEMNKYPVGKPIRVLLCDAGRVPMTCSTKIETALSTADSKDVFTGAVAPDGSISLKTFTRNYTRVFEVLEDMVLPMMESKANFIRRDEAIRCVTESLKTRYNATSIDPRAVPGILRQLCSPDAKIMPLPLLRSEKGGFALTDHAWSELGGRNKYLSDGQKPEAIQPEPEPEPVGAPDPVDMGVVITPPDAEISQEPRDTEINLEVATEINLEVAAVCFGKLCRMAEIDSQLSSLLAEKKAIEEWMEENEEARKSVQGLSALTKIQEASKAVLDRISGTPSEFR